MTKEFKDLGLSEKTLAAVERLGYTNPTPIQEQAIPLALEGRDIIAAAKTGTGKTAAFSLPSMNNLGHVQRGQGPLMLVITPTRELASQIAEVCEVIAKSTNHRIATVVGGVSYDPQIKRLQSGVDVLIATPGRLIDLMEKRAVKLNNVEVFVLDEADRMLDMGFWPSVKRIAAQTSSHKQTLLFSATIDRAVTDGSGALLNNPAFVEIAHKGETADSVEQYIVPVPQTAKPELLKATLRAKGSDRVIVFARTKSRADSSTRRLKKAGFSVEAIHSDRSQAQRKRALDNFSKGRTSILVATDVLARGIDVTEVDYVINYDLPNQPEDYIHRIGRTGRAGEKGFAISFVSPDQKAWLKDIEKLIKREIPTIEIKNFDPEQAEADAAARATNYAAKHDPELAAAAKQDAQRRKKKMRSKGEQGSNSRKHPGAPSRKPKQGGQKKSYSNQGNKQSSKNSSNSSRSKSQAAPKQGASDMRPGRARRAQVAKQRRK